MAANPEKNNKIRKPIDEQENLYRCIIASVHVIYDPNIKKHRLSSRALKGKEISVDVASKTTPQKTLTKLNKSNSVSSLLARVPLNLDLNVLEDPIADNPAHAVIIRKDGKKIQGAASRKMAENCVWVIPPEGYDLYEPIIETDF